MTTAELRAKRNALIADARAIQKKETITVEDRTAFDSIIAKADEVGLDITRTEKLDAMEAETRSFVAPPRPQPGEAETRSVEQRKTEVAASYRSYLSTGKVETRDLTVSADGVLIPQLVGQPVIAKKFAGCIHDCINIMKTSTGAPVKVPLLNDTGNGFVLNSGAITVTDPAVAGVTISIDDYRSNPILVETSLMQDIEFDIESFINNSISTRYLRTVSQQMTVGNGSNIGGLSAIAFGIQTATVATLAYPDFVKACFTLDPSYTFNACWCMNNTTLGIVMGFVDGNGRPLFLPYLDGPASGFVGTILGYPVKINQYLPNVATGAVAVQFGDFKEGYTFREVGGVSVLRLAERYAELKKVGFVAFARVGGAVTDAGTHPVISVTIK